MPDNGLVAVCNKLLSNSSVTEQSMDLGVMLNEIGLRFAAGGLTVAANGELHIASFLVDELTIGSFGNTVIVGWANIAGDVNCQSTLEVAGNSTFSSNVNIASNLSVAGISAFTGNASFSGFVNVASTLQVGGNTLFLQNVAVQNALVNIYTTLGSVAGPALKVTGNNQTIVQLESLDGLPGVGAYLGLVSNTGGTRYANVFFGNIQGDLVLQSNGITHLTVNAAGSTLANGTFSANGNTAIAGTLSVGQNAVISGAASGAGIGRLTLKGAASDSDGFHVDYNNSTNETTIDSAFAGTLHIQTNSVERLAINASSIAANVPLTVNGFATVNTATQQGNAPLTVLGGSGADTVRLYGSGTTGPGIIFGNLTTGILGQLFATNAGELDFISGVGGVNEPLALKSDGSVVVNGAFTVNATSNLVGNVTTSGFVNVATTLQVSGNVLFTGALINVSHGTTSLGGELDVAGNLILAGREDITGNLSVTGNAAFGAFVNIASTLQVAGASTLNGLLTANAGLTVNGTASFDNTISANGAVGSALQVLTSGGPGQNAYWQTLGGDVDPDANTTVSGFINTSAQTLAGDKTWNGNTTVNNMSFAGNVTSALNVAGNSVFSSNVTVTSGFLNVSTSGVGTALRVTGNNQTVATFESTDGVNGTVGVFIGLFSNTGGTRDANAFIGSVGGNVQIQANNNTWFIVAATGAITANANTTVNGYINGSSTLQITGNASLSNVIASGWANVAGMMNVSGNSTLTGNVTTGGFVNVGTTLQVAGNIVSGNVIITGYANVSGAINVAGNSTLTGNVTTGGFVNVGTTLQVAGNIVSGNVIVTGYANVSGAINVAGNSTLTGNVTTSGFVNVGTTLHAQGALTVDANSTLTGNVTTGGFINVGSSLQVATTSLLNGIVTVNAAASVNGTLTIKGNLIANTANGTAGQFLTSGNTANAYWSTPPDANSSTSGYINTAAQTFAGDKTFNGNTTANNLALNGNVTTSMNVSGNVNVTGNLVVTGNSTFTGNVTAGNVSTGNLTVTNTLTLPVGNIEFNAGGTYTFDGNVIINNVASLLSNSTGNTLFVSAESQFGANVYIISGANLTFIGSASGAAAGPDINFPYANNNTDIVVNRSAAGTLNFNGTAGGGIQLGNPGLSGTAHLLLLNDTGGIAFANATGGFETYISRVAAGILGVSAAGYSAADGNLYVTDVRTNSIHSLTNLTIAPNTTISGNATVSGFANLSGTLQVAGNTLFNANVTSNANVTVNGTTTLVATTGGVWSPVLAINANGVFANTLMTIRTDTSDAAHPALFIEDFTNFAFSNALVSFQLHNGSDSADALRIQNAGTGPSINADGKFNLLNTGIVSKYAGIATAGDGLAVVINTIARTAQTASNTGATIYTPTVNGLFRLSVFAQFTHCNQAATLGGCFVGFNGANNQGTNAEVFTSNNSGVANVSAGNTAGNVLQGTHTFYATSANAITFTINMTNTSANSMYEVYVTLEGITGR